MTAFPPRRVAIVTHFPALSGAELALLRLATNLDRSRYIPVVVTFADGPLVDCLRGNGVEVAVVPLAGDVGTVRRDQGLMVATATYGWSVMRFAPRLARVLKALRIEAVHAHSLKSGMICGLVAPLIGVPMVWHVHDRISNDYLPPMTTRLMRLLIRRLPRHVVVNSVATAETLLPLGRGWTLAYPGLDPAAFHQSERTADSSTDPARPPIVGILGRLGPTKGQDLFLRAAAEVRRFHPQARFRVIGASMFGESEYEHSLHELCRNLDLEEAVEFTGFVADPGTALRELDVCVHASPVPEPFGQVIVEAMAAMVPTVVTDAGGASEIVHDGDHVLARLATAGRVDDIAGGIRWILDNRQDAEEMATGALDSVRRRFGIAGTAEAIMAAWDTVVGGRPS